MIYAVLQWSDAFPVFPLIKRCKSTTCSVFRRKAGMRTRGFATTLAVLFLHESPPDATALSDDDVRILYPEDVILLLS